MTLTETHIDEKTEREIKFVKTDIKPHTRKLAKNWKIYEGHEVCDMNWPPRILRYQDDIEKGVCVTILDAWGDIRRAICEKPTSTQCWAKDHDTSCNTTYSLKFNNDDRKCWVCELTNCISFDITEELTNVLGTPLSTFDCEGMWLNK